MKYLLRFFSFNLFFITVFVQNAWAYIDPGTGSYIFQILIGLFVAAGYVIKIFWRSILTFFSNLFSKEKNKTKS